jgi:hypothetical protein
MAFLAKTSFGSVEPTANFVSTHRWLSRVNGSVLLVLLPKWLQLHRVFGLRRLNKIEQILSGVVGYRSMDTASSRQSLVVKQVTRDHMGPFLLAAPWLESLRSGCRGLVV